MTVEKFNDIHGYAYKTKRLVDHHDGKTITILDVDVDKTSAWCIVNMIENGVPLRRDWYEDENGKLIECFKIEEELC